MSYFDRNPDVVKWSSEEFVIPYVSPIDGKRHRYFIDFVVINKKGETFLLEVKPYKQTQEPKPKKTLTPRYIKEVQTWAINTSKWKAAQALCEEKGWKFDFITEKDLEQYK